MTEAFLNMLISTEGDSFSFQPDTSTIPVLTHDENTMSMPPGGDDNSSLTTPIETWIVDTTLTSFSFITAPIMLILGEIFTRVRK